MPGREDRAAGLAALSICESLLLTLRDKNVLDLEEIQAALEDAAAAHRSVEARYEGEEDLHAAAARLIERIVADLSS
jgi:hypothetical protein